jgi:hypothetical protein
MFDKDLKSLRTFLYDAYWPPFTPELSYDAAQGIELCKKANANAIRFGSIGKYALYPSRIVPSHPKLNNRDLLQETIEAGKNAGVRVIGYIPVGHALPAGWLKQLKPDWIFRNEAGEPVAPEVQYRHFGGETLFSVCAFGAYRQAIRAIVNEIIDHDIYAVYLDGPYQGWGVEHLICQCESCKKRFMAETGYKLPDNQQKKELGGIYLEWSRNNLLGLLREIRQTTKAKNLPLMMNRTAGLLCGTRFEIEMLKEVDCFLIESDHGGIEGCSVASALDKRIWNYTNRHAWHPRLSNAPFEQQSLLCGRNTLSFGGIPIISYAGRFFNSDKHIGSIARLFKDSEKALGIAPGAVMSRFACVLRNSNERQFAVADIDGVEITDEAINIADSFSASGIPVMVLPDLFLDNAELINSFKILFVTEYIKLNPEREEFLHRFARNGGTVVFTGIVPPEFTGVVPSVPDSRLQAAMDTQYWCEKRYDCYLRSPGFDLLPQIKSHILKSVDADVIAASIIFDADGEISYPSVFKRKTGKGCCIVFDSPIEKILSGTGGEIDRFFKSVCMDEIKPPLALRENSIPVSVSLLENADAQFLYVAASGTGSIKFSTDSGKTGLTNFGGELKQDGNDFSLDFNEFEIVTLK